MKIVIKSQGKRTKEKEQQPKKPQTINKIAMSTYLSIITLNVNGLNAQIKKYRVAELIQKQNSYICSYKDSLQI